MKTSTLFNATESSKKNKTLKEENKMKNILYVLIVSLICVSMYLPGIADAGDYGEYLVAGDIGQYGRATNTKGKGLYGKATGPQGTGVYGIAYGFEAVGVTGVSRNGAWAGRFYGDVDVRGLIHSEALNVHGPILQHNNMIHADYVFESDYDLKSIEEHAKFMWNNKHLKAIPKKTVDKDGLEFVEAGAHRRGIVEELEVAHIYIEQLNKQINEQNGQIKEIREQLAKLETSGKVVE